MNALSFINLISGKTNSMKDYIKKPVVIQAEQWHDMTDPIVGGPLIVYPYREGFGRCEHCHEYMIHHGYIMTLEGGHIVCPNDYIIKGVAGEFYPCKPAIFDLTYDSVPS